MYVRKYVWHEQTTLSINGELVECDREFVRATDVMRDTARCYWPMDLVEIFVRQNWCVVIAHCFCRLILRERSRCLRLRWEEEKPSWFTEAWKARVPPGWLKGLDRTLARRASGFDDSAETKLHRAVRDAPPWCLDANALATWLESNWVRQDDDASNGGLREKQRRRALAQRLVGTNGLELLEACSSEDPKPPFVKITHTKRGNKLKDTSRAEHLTAFLQARAGLGFYYQLSAVASDRFSPLFDYEYVQLVSESPHVLTSLIRSKVSDQVYALELTRKSATRSLSTEMTLHAKACAASERVLKLHHRGSSSAQAYFAIKEHCASNLRSRIVVGEGVPEEDFWRLSSQLARGVGDIHGIGICHLGIEPDSIHLADDTGDIRISDFRNAREAEAAATLVPYPADKSDYQAPESSLNFAADVFSVGLVLFEMATGALPGQERDLLITIDDPAKRELIAFALRDDPSERPTADELLQKITMLAPSSMMESEFRAQVFASMRFNDHGPMAEANLLRAKLAAQGVHLHIIAPRPGESIDAAVFGTLAKCDAFLAMATRDYGADTGNTASTFHEARTWIKKHQPKGRPLIPMRMVSTCFI